MVLEAARSERKASSGHQIDDYVSAAADESRLGTQKSIYPVILID